MTTPPLLACPFCGGKAEVHTEPAGKDTLYVVLCENRCTTLGLWTLDRAVENWNTRSKDPLAGELRAKLSEQIEPIERTMTSGQGMVVDLGIDGWARLRTYKRVLEWLDEREAKGE